MSKFKKFLAPLGAVAGNAIAPGIGGVIGGALGGAASGGGVKGALTGGLTGAAIGYAPDIGGFVNSNLGLGLTNTSSLAALGGGLAGAAAGGISGGGIKGALTGGITGGLGGYLANGGLGEIGSSLGLTGDGGALSGISSYLPGTAAGTPLANGVGPTAGSGLQGLVTGGGINAVPSLSGLSSLTGGGGSGNMFVSGLSALNQYSTAGKAEKDMLEAQRRAEGVLAPYQQTGQQANQMLSQDLASGDLGGQFTMGDFQADPGYQFRKQQGEEALARAQAARGGVFSGAALREAADLNQQLADQAYNDAYGRWMQQQQQRYGMLSGTSGSGQNAAAGLGGIYGTMGDIRANAGMSQANAITGFAADAFGGDIIGYNPDGTPITRQSALLGRMRGLA